MISIQLCGRLWLLVALAGLVSSSLATEPDATGGDDAATTAPIPTASADQIRQAVDRGIGYLQTESANWMSTRKCAACHHAPLPLWSLGEADRQGYSINKQYVAETIEATLGSHEKLISSKLIPGPNDPPDTRPLASGVRTGTVFMAFAARSLTSLFALTPGQEESLRTITAGILEKQRSDGGWDFFLSRPPINERESSDAAWIIMTLQGETGENSPEAQRAALAKALAWYAAAPLTADTQDKVFKIVVASRAGSPRDQWQPALDELLASQRPDGGWGQNADLPSDAYATGQALYALAVGGRSTPEPALQRGVDYLVAKQLADGSWPMTSRSSPDGSTGGSAKLLTPIQCAAASWAVAGLARLVPHGE